MAVAWKDSGSQKWRGQREQIESVVRNCTIIAKKRGGDSPASLKAKHRLEDGKHRRYD